MLSSFGSSPGFSRRHFFQMAGGLTSVGIIGLAGCKKDDESDPRVDLGSGDAGLLNYFYALEQLEAAFYTEVLTRIGTGTTLFSFLERDRLTDLRDHESLHRDFFKASIIAAGALPVEEVAADFSSVDYTKRASILAAAQTLEDLGVAAYNGALPLFTDTTLLLAVSKIASVEARHAAYIRDLSQEGSFADLDALAALGGSKKEGLDVALMPQQVLALAEPFLITTLSADNLPTR